MSRRKLPPYGRQVVGVLNEPDSWHNYVGTSADECNLTFWIGIGSDAWGWANERPAGKYLAVAIPPEADPECFNWEFLAGHDPVMLCAAGDVEPDHAEKAAHALIRDGVQRVLFIPNGGTPWHRFLAPGMIDVA